MPDSSALTLIRRLVVALAVLIILLLTLGPIVIGWHFLQPFWRQDESKVLLATALLSAGVVGTAVFFAQSIVTYRLQKLEEHTNIALSIGMERELPGIDLRSKNLSDFSLVGRRLHNADLSWTNLTGADLSRVELDGASLIQADMNGARLNNSQLRGADLRLANLRGADVVASNLSGANLRKTRFSNAVCAGSSFDGADFRKARLKFATTFVRCSFAESDTGPAEFRRAKLSDVLSRIFGTNRFEGCDFRGAVLERAHLKWARLGPAPAGTLFFQRPLGRGIRGFLLMVFHKEARHINADLGRGRPEQLILLGSPESEHVIQEIRLQQQPEMVGELRSQKFVLLVRSDFSGANLRMARLSHADLSFAILRGANLSDAQLQGADLRGTNLRDTNLSGARFNGAVCDQHTKWPPGFKPESEGIRKIVTNVLVDYDSKKFSAASQESIRADGVARPRPRRRRR
jgi:uncharacterized protein YjbI with pentapeptide repeats